MNIETYMPKHSARAADCMAKRSFDSRGQFFAGYLRGGRLVLDCSCGPGSIAMGIVQRVYPGKVIGTDSVFAVRGVETPNWMACREHACRRTPV